MTKVKDEVIEEEKHNIIDDLLLFKRPVGDVNINPVNSLVHGDAEIEEMAAGLAEFGQRMPIFINKNSNQITAGNKRFLAAKKLGWTHIAVIGEEDDLMTSTRWGLSDNLLSRHSSWNLTNVPEMIKAMGDDGKQFQG